MYGAISVQSEQTRLSHVLDNLRLKLLIQANPGSILRSEIDKHRCQRSLQAIVRVMPASYKVDTLADACNRERGHG